MRFVWAGENAAIALGCAPKAERLVCGENAIQPQTEPTAKRTAHFSQLRCALWDEEVFVDSFQFSMSGHGQIWDCEEVRIRAS